MLSVKTASPVQCPPRGLHREQTLGEGFGERKGSFAERNLTLGEDLESGSGREVLLESTINNGYLIIVRALPLSIFV
jgi:hypothetical protein